MEVAAYQSMGTWISTRVSGPKKAAQLEKYLNLNENRVLFHLTRQKDPGLYGWSLERQSGQILGDLDQKGPVPVRTKPGQNPKLAKSHNRTKYL